MKIQEGKHIGKLAFMNIPKDLPKRADVIILTLMLGSCNASAMKFYESCGLKPLQKVHMETIFDKRNMIISRFLRKMIIH